MDKIIENKQTPTKEEKELMDVKENIKESLKDYQVEDRVAEID